MLLSFSEAFASTFHDKFQFDDFLSLKINQEFKTIEVNKKLALSTSVKLKKYHRFLNNFVFDYAKVNTNVVYSYRKETNIYNAIEKHAQNKYFFQTDLINFFSSIKTQDIESVFNNNLGDIPINDFNNYSRNVLNLVTIDNELPIGFATSPSISNTCLFEFDNLLERQCLQNEIIYTRYSDDLIFSTNTRLALNDIHKTITQHLEIFFQNRMNINLSKTKQFQKGEKIKLLGLVILPNSKITVDIELKKQIEILMYFYVNNKDKFTDYLKNCYKGSIDKIAGQLKFINMIDRTFLNKLRKKYGNYIVDAFYNNSIEQ